MQRKLANMLSPLLSKKSSTPTGSPRTHVHSSPRAAGPASSPLLVVVPGTVDNSNAGSDGMDTSISSRCGSWMAIRRACVHNWADQSARACPSLLC